MTNVTEEVGADLLHLMAGALIGEGQYRTVYQSNFNAGQVIKHDNCLNWSNVNEFLLYRECIDTPLEKWLAPCLWLSPRGFWLIQAKTTPLKGKDFPKRIPAIFADTKDTNWGMYKGRPVCHDYGNNSVYTLAKATGKKLVAATWERYL